MESNDFLILKLDAFAEAIKTNIDLSRQTLDEIKRTNDAFATHVNYLTKESERLWDELDKEKESKKKIYERLEKVESLISKHVNGPMPTRAGIDSESFGKHAAAWVHSGIAKWLLWALTIVGSVWLTRWAGTLPQFAPAQPVHYSREYLRELDADPEGRSISVRRQIER